MEEKTVQENSLGHAIKDLLKDYQEREGWEIALIGTDMSAIMDMSRRSMRQDKMRHYKQHQKREALYNLSQSVSEYYTGDDKSFTLDKKVDCGATPSRARGAQKLILYVVQGLKRLDKALVDVVYYLRGRPPMRSSA